MNTEKGKQIQKMFSSIAHRYDLLNHLLSMGFDVGWRKFTVNQVLSSKDNKVLDLCCGTGDLSIALANGLNEKGSVTGLDFCKEMVDLATEKTRETGLAGKISYLIGKAEELPFPDGYFDAVTIAFGIRNVPDRDMALREMYRVIKKDGRIAILELTNPQSYLFRKIYCFYFHNIVPLIGGLISGNSYAYSYLPDSVLKFPSPKMLKKIMEDNGLTNITYRNLTFGIVSVHLSVKN
ncbi:MAG: bifunctional demethylmenaquinone methyltransferase/2-methoxy-6-polyprenyl-1,4-benzoquinol methylase UbiE [bacterium]